MTPKMLKKAVNSLDGDLRGLIETEVGDMLTRLDVLTDTHLTLKGLIGADCKFETMKDWAEWITENSRTEHDELSEELRK